METYNSVDLVVDGQRVGQGDVSVGVDLGHGSDEAAVALLERRPAGGYEVKWSVPINRREVRRISGRSEHLCWKCRDGRTRAHHRLCSKRGGKWDKTRSAMMRVYGRHLRRLATQQGQILANAWVDTANHLRLDRLAALFDVARQEAVGGVREVS